jgi:hypothetical protein
MTNAYAWRGNSWRARRTSGSSRGPRVRSCAAEGRFRPTLLRQTKPILAVSGLKMRVGRKTKPIGIGGRPKMGTGTFRAAGCTCPRFRAAWRVNEYAKQSQFSAFLGQKWGLWEKQSQFKANLPGRSDWNLRSIRLRSGRLRRSQISNFKSQIRWRSRLWAICGSVPCVLGGGPL